MIRNLLIVVTLVAFGLDASAGCCCSHYSYASFRSECPCAETMLDSDAANEFDCEACPHKQSGEPCKEGHSLWLSDLGLMIESVPKISSFSTFAVSRTVAASNDLRHCIQTLTAGNWLSFRRLHGVLSVWLI